MPTAAQIHRIAREERARRKAAAKAAGQGLSDRAMADDVIWSNIEHMAGREAGNPECLKKRPHYWTRPERVVMVRNAWATAAKAETALDMTIAANREKLSGLWQLYRWLRPLGWSPIVPEAK